MLSHAANAFTLSNAPSLCPSYPRSGLTPCSLIFVSGSRLIDFAFSPAPTSPCIRRLFVETIRPHLEVLVLNLQTNCQLEQEGCMRQCKARL